MELSQFVVFADVNCREYFTTVETQMNEKNGLSVLTQCWYRSNI